MDSTQVQLCFNRVLQEAGIGKNARVLVGVSGGVDSMVLLYLCVQSGLQIVVAHMNYALRGEDSEADANLVANSASRYACAFVQKKVDLLAISAGKNLEEEARNLRYEWFNQLRKVHNCVAILLAHHADDNVETALLNFLRPSGLLGISAMPYKHNQLLRPLLDCPKSALYVLAKAENIEFREDFTNLETRFLRNFLRNQILPQLSAKIPNLQAIITQNIRHYQESYAIYQAHIAQMRSKYLREQNGIYVASVGALKNLSPLRTWVYEFFREFVDRARQIDAVLQLLDAESGKYLCTQNYEILRYKTELQVIPRLQTADSEGFPILIEKLPFECNLPNKGELKIELEENLVDVAELIAELKAQNNHKNIYLDAKDLDFPLLLRPLRAGDYYYPLGLGKKKKLSREVREQNWGRAKVKIWVLETLKGHIVWAWGLRPDNRHKLSVKTECALKIQIDRLFEYEKL